jgi:hypothetical protein
VVAAAGNEATDLTHPETDELSFDFHPARRLPGMSTPVRRVGRGVALDGHGLGVGPQASWPSTPTSATPSMAADWWTPWQQGYGPSVTHSEWGAGARRPLPFSGHGEENPFVALPMGRRPR